MSLKPVQLLVVILGLGCILLAGCKKEEPSVVNQTAAPETKTAE